MKPNFDTYAAYVALVNAGFLEKQAQELLEVLKDSQADLATKQDLADLEHRLTVNSADIEHRLTVNLTDLEHRLTIRMGTMMAAGIGLTAALVKLL